MTRSAADIVWWAARDGAAHAALPGSAVAFCGAQVRVRVGQGRPCARCLTAATDWVTADPDTPALTVIEGDTRTPIRIEPRREHR